MGGLSCRRDDREWCGDIGYLVAVIENLDEHLNGEEDEVEAEDQEQSGHTGEEIPISNPLKRKNLVDHISKQRNSKLMEKIPVEKVMLDVAKEDVALKKEIFSEMKSQTRKSPISCESLMTQW